MRKKSKTRAYPSQVGNKDEEIQTLGTCITDIPSHIFHMVLLKLSMMSILICKCVCKTWRDQILGLAFAKEQLALLSSHEASYPLLRPCSSRRLSRTLYLIVPDETSSDFDSNDDPNSKGSDVPRKIIVKLQLPLRNVDKLIDKHTAENQDTSSSTGNPGIRISSIDHQYDVVNSCNGFLLLANKCFNDPAVVCNPVTGEYMHLPEASKHNQRRLIDCAIGFIPKTNQYKVLRIVHKGNLATEAEILTLGAGSWKKLVRTPNLARKKVEAFPIYFKGALYWLYSDRSMFSFDLDSEKFLEVRPPPFGYGKCLKSSMGVLGGCLCVCEASRGMTNVWVQEDYGSGGHKFWWKKICIENNCNDRLSSVVHYPMKFFKNESLLMFNCCTDALLYNHRSNLRPVYLKLNGTKSSFEAISHVPSFISLKDILVGGDHVQVLNINSRCENLSLQKETAAVFVQEKIPVSDSCASVKWCELSRPAAQVWR